MRVPEREKARFVSGGTECAAWHYPGTNGACVIMAGGFGVTKEPATDRFARRFKPFLGGHEQAVEAELSFLRRHLLASPPPKPVRPAAPATGDAA
jgi:hypothetical protein